VNTRKDVAHYAARAGLELAEFSYVGQYPSYFLFNGPLFFLATLYQKLIERGGAAPFSVRLGVLRAVEAD
jgi:hypothetical protein